MCDIHITKYDVPKMFQKTYFKDEFECAKRGCIQWG